jgi:predicted nucleic acid-binding protein
LTGSASISEAGTERFPTARLPPGRIASGDLGPLRPLAPDLIYPEFANAVWKRVGRDRLSPEDGTAIIATFLALPFEITSSSSLLVPAYRLAVEHRRSVYDALFLALGLEAGAEVVTADEPLYQAVHAHLPHVWWLGNWPQKPQ